MCFIFQWYLNKLHCALFCRKEYDAKREAKAKAKANKGEHKTITWDEMLKGLNEEEQERMIKTLALNHQLPVSAVMMKDANIYDDYGVISESMNDYDATGADLNVYMLIFGLLIVGICWLLMFIIGLWSGWIMRRHEVSQRKYY